MKVDIRFLRQGIVRVEAPADFDKMTDEEKIEWAHTQLDKLSDKEILEAMADFDNPEKNGWFDESPFASAIEAPGGKPIVLTKEWEAFTNYEIGSQIVKTPDHE